MQLFSEYEVRQLSKEDAETFRQVRLEALRSHPEAFSASLEQTERKALVFFEQLLEHNKVFGGFDSCGQLQGIIGIYSGESPKTSHVATIFGMYVRLQARGSGLSRNLIQEALRAASPASIVKLSVNANNKRAYILYRSIGFTEWARDEEALCIDNVLYDEILMKIKLN